MDLTALIWQVLQTRADVALKTILLHVRVKTSLEPKDHVMCNRTLFRPLFRNQRIAMLKSSRQGLEETEMRGLRLMDLAQVRVGRNR